MVDTAREMNFAFMAGSSLPVARRFPPIEIPNDTEIEEVVGIGPGGIDGYDIHKLESIQSMVERRRGGETGVVAMHALRSNTVLKALKIDSWIAGGFDSELFDSCLFRSLKLTPPREGFNHYMPSHDEIATVLNHEPIAYRYEYANGLKATMFLLERLIHDPTFAARLKGHSETLSTLMYLPRRNFFRKSTPSRRRFLPARQHTPSKRTLLMIGLTAAGVESLWLGKRIDAPHLAIRYVQPKIPPFGGADNYDYETRLSQSDVHGRFLASVPQASIRRIQLVLPG